MKARFSPADDILLAEAVNHLGTRDWSLIANELPGRNARQCRERWRNYVSPELIHEAWTESEDERLLNTVKEVGPKWHLMLSYFPGRSRNSIHNRFVTLQRINLENAGKSNNDVEIRTIQAAPDTPKTNSPASNHDGISFQDFLEACNFARLFADLESDFDF
jgi:hypothetical protein